MRTHALLLSLSFLALLAGCTTKPPAPPEYGEIKAGSFAQAWQADLLLSSDDGVVGMDLLGDLLVVRTRNNAAFGISAAGGTVRWATQVVPAGRVLGAPVLVTDRIVFPASDELIVYDLKGRRDKVIPLHRAVRSPLGTDGKIVYLGFDYGSQGRLGRVVIGDTYVPIRWELMGRGSVSAAPATFQDGIYSGSEDGNVYAVNEARLPLWTGLPSYVFSTGGPIVADLRADDTGVYVASTDSKLYALDRISGRIKWQYFAGVQLTFGPVVTADSVYVMVPGKGVAALDKITGEFNREPRWINPSATAVLGEDATNVYLLEGDRTIVAVDKKTGAASFRTARHDLAIFAPAAGGNLLFAATANGTIMGIKPVKTGGTSGQLVAAPVSERNSAAFGG